MSGPYIRRSRHGQALGTSLEWEDLTRDNPGEGSPRRGEKEDVDANEGDGCLLRRDVEYQDVALGILTRGRGA